MNLPYAFELLAAADEQRHGFIKLRGIQANYEVRLMSEAGLVEATFDDGQEGSFTAINRVTPTGKTFLRAFQNHAIPAEAALGASSHAVVTAKWKARFDSDLLPFRAAHNDFEHDSADAAISAYA
jgi:hypothetical protein